MKLKTGKTSGNNKHFGMLTCVNSILGSLPLKYQMQPQNFCTYFNHACKHNCTWTVCLQTFTNEILINLGFVIGLHKHLTTYSTGVSFFVCQCSSDIFRLKYKLNQNPIIITVLLQSLFVKVHIYCFHYLLNLIHLYLKQL